VHEISLCQSLIDQVQQIAVTHGALGVGLVTLRIGPLSGVDPSLMQNAYPFAAAGSLAEESKLLIELSPLRVRCEGCGSETEVEPSLLICAVCGSHHTELVSGDEMTLMSVELVTRGEVGHV